MSTFYDVCRVLSFDRVHNAEQKTAAVEPEESVQSEVIDNLRAALDVERSTAQQLTESLQQERERVTRLTAECSQLNDQLSAERSVIGQLRNALESAVVSCLLLSILLSSS